MGRSLRVVRGIVLLSPPIQNEPNITAYSLANASGLCGVLVLSGNQETYPNMQLFISSFGICINM